MPSLLSGRGTVEHSGRIFLYVLRQVLAVQKAYNDDDEEWLLRFRSVQMPVIGNFFRFKSDQHPAGKVNSLSTPPANNIHPQKIVVCCYDSHL